MIFTFDHITTFALVLIGILTLIVLVGNAATVVSKWYKGHKDPLDLLEERVEVLEAQAKKFDEKLNGDWEFRQKTAKFNVLMLKCMNQLLEHEIDGNNIAGLETMKEEVEDYLYETSQQNAKV